MIGKGRLFVYQVLVAVVLCFSIVPGSIVIR